MHMWQSPLCLLFSTPPLAISLSSHRLLHEAAAGKLTRPSVEQARPPVSSPTGHDTGGRQRRRPEATPWVSHTLPPRGLDGETEGRAVRVVCLAGHLSPARGGDHAGRVEGAASQRGGRPAGQPMRVETASPLESTRKGVKPHRIRA
jgi:hypothetical protein